MTIRCRFAWAGFELGSPDYQEKVLSTMLVRDHPVHSNLGRALCDFRYIGPPKSWNRVSKTDREVITALERKGSRGCSAGRGGWSCGAWVPGMWQRVAQTRRGLGAVQASGGCVPACNRSRRGHHCKVWQLGVDLREQDLNSDLQITKKRCYPLR